MRGRGGRADCADTGAASRRARPITSAAADDANKYFAIAYPTAVTLSPKAVMRRVPINGAIRFAIAPYTVPHPARPVNVDGVACSRLCSWDERAFNPPRARRGAPARGARRAGKAAAQPRAARRLLGGRRRRAPAV